MIILKESKRSSQKSLKVDVPKGSKLVGFKHQEQDVISIESRYRSSNNMCSILSIQIKVLDEHVRVK